MRPKHSKLKIVLGRNEQFTSTVTYYVYDPHFLFCLSPSLPLLSLFPPEGWETNIKRCGLSGDVVAVQRDFRMPRTVVSLAVTQLMIHIRSALRVDLGPQVRLCFDIQSVASLLIPIFSTSGPGPTVSTSFKLKLPFFFLASLSDCFFATTTTNCRDDTLVSNVMICARFVECKARQQPKTISFSTCPLKGNCRCISYYMGYPVVSRWNGQQSSRASLAADLNIAWKLTAELKGVQ